MRRLHYPGRQKIDSGRLFVICEAGRIIKIVYSAEISKQSTKNYSIKRFNSKHLTKKINNLATAEKYRNMKLNLFFRWHSISMFYEQMLYKGKGYWSFSPSENLLYLKKIRCAFIVYIKCVYLFHSFKVISDLTIF